MSVIINCSAPIKQLNFKTRLVISTYYLKHGTIEFLDYNMVKSDIYYFTRPYYPRLREDIEDRQPFSSNLYIKSKLFLIKNNSIQPFFIPEPLGSSFNKEYVKVTCVLCEKQERNYHYKLEPSELWICAECMDNFNYYDRDIYIDKDSTLNKYDSSIKVIFNNIVVINNKLIFPYGVNCTNQYKKIISDQQYQNHIIIGTYIKLPST